MKTFLKILFAAILVWMVVMTIYVQSYRPLMLSPGEFSWKGSPWACATLFDAYFGFLTFSVWVCFKERSYWAKAIWFVLIMALGNIAMSGYVLVQLFALRPGEPVQAILTRKS